MRTELAVAFVAGLFGLIPLIVQIVSTSAQRRDRLTRLNHLRAELELLERLHTLQGKVGAIDEAAKPQTDLIIRDSLSKLLDEYNELSEVTPSAVVGGKQPSAQQLSFLRRALLLYNPHTISGWVLHTLFYTTAIIFGFLLFGAVALGTDPSIGMRGVWGIVILATPIGISLPITQRLARRDAARNVAQSQEPNA